MNITDIIKNCERIRKDWTKFDLDRKGTSARKNPDDDLVHYVPSKPGPDDVGRYVEKVKVAAPKK